MLLCKNLFLSVKNTSQKIKFLYFNIKKIWLKFTDKECDPNSFSKYTKKSCVCKKWISSLN